MAAGEISPSHMTSDSGDLHSVDQAGLSASRGSLRYQGTDYTILDESPFEQALCLSQGSRNWCHILRLSNLRCRTGSAILLPFGLKFLVNLRWIFV